MVDCLGRSRPGAPYLPPQAQLAHNYAWTASQPSARELVGRRLNLEVMITFADTNRDEPAADAIHPRGDDHEPFMLDLYKGYGREALNTRTLSFVTPGGWTETISVEPREHGYGPGHRTFEG